ncbi:hypothetical protein SDC9_198178 [bioreactor metagenome]|uniref:Uncharacterized protein n=1 Tax=bioreactor metagenome TaxID=1076179 RepID=A0A645IGX6_9ZZZZ
MKKALRNAPPVERAKLLQIDTDALLGKSKYGIISRVSDVERRVIRKNRLSAPAPLKMRMTRLLAKDCVEQ